MKLIFLIALQIASGFCKKAFDPLDSGLILSEYLKEIFEEYGKDRKNISAQCQSDVSLFLNDLKQGNVWALKMLDSSFKIGAGLLEGNIDGLGSFDECIGINHATDTRRIMGNYCLSVNYGNLTVIQSVCVPNSCGPEDIKTFLSQFNVSVLQKPSCQTQDSSSFDAVSLTAAIFFGCVVVLTIASTIYDVAARYIFKEKRSVLLSAFSILSNGKKIFTVTSHKNEITCVYGIRVLSMAWIIFAHIYSVMVQFPMTNKFSALNGILNHDYDYILGGSKAVDTFLLLSGFMLSYIFLSSASVYKFNLPVFYLHRLLRLTPALGAVILIYVGLIQFLSSGPLWPEIFSNEREMCLKYWWQTILYINNYSAVQCVGQTWFLSVDMQLYVLSPLILLPLSKKPTLGLCLTWFFTICVMVTCFSVTWIYDIDVNFLYTNNVSTYRRMYYNVTHTRASPWLIGIILGYAIRWAKQRKFEINRLLIILLWVLSITILVVCGLFELESYDKTIEVKVRDALYNTFVRPLWSVAVAWTIFACCFDMGGFINQFLSLPIFQVLSRLTYANYLTHLLLIYIYQGHMQNPMFYSYFDMSILFWGLYMYTQFASILLTLCFESPIIVIEKLMFARNADK